jgi:hypothetical protein
MRARAEKEKGYKHTSQNTAQTHRTNQSTEPKKKTYCLLKTLSTELFAAQDFDGKKVSDVTEKNSPTMFRNPDKNVCELLAYLECTYVRI